MIDTASVERYLIASSMSVGSTVQRSQVHNPDNVRFLKWTASGKGFHPWARELEVTQDERSRCLEANVAKLLSGSSGDLGGFGPSKPSGAWRKRETPRESPTTCCRPAACMLKTSTNTFQVVRRIGPSPQEHHSSLSFTWPPDLSSRKCEKCRLGHLNPGQGPASPLASRVLTVIALGFPS